MGYYLIKEPSYFRDFVCRGAECESNCCNGWEDIIWLNDEYERLCALDLTKEMLENVKSAFEMLEIPEYDGVLWNLRLSGKNCPFLAENSLCSIQRDFGEEFISNTCRVYPRVSVYNEGVLTRGCYMSCPEIANAVIDSESALEICTRQIPASEEKVVLRAVLCEDESDFEKNPAMRFRNEIFSLFYDIVSCPKKSVYENLGMALSAAFELSKAEDIPKTAEIIQRGVCSERNEELFAGVSELLREFFGEEYVLDYEKIKAVQEIFPKHFLKNIALNLLFELKMPFCFGDGSVYENFRFYTLVFGIFTAVLFRAAVCKKSVTGELSRVDRKIVHDRAVMNRIAERI